MQNYEAEYKIYLGLHNIMHHVNYDHVVKEAKWHVAIFSLLDLKADRIDIFYHNLSGIKCHANHVVQ